MPSRPFPRETHAKARETHHLFFAIWPDDGVRARIADAAAELRRAHAPRGRWIRPHRYHLTLRFLGEYAHVPDQELALAGAAGDHVHAAPFDLVLDAAGSFRNRSIPWWIGCDSIPEAWLALTSSLADALQTVGWLAKASKRPVPHVTVLRDADAALPSSTIPPIAWPVTGFVLIDSRLGADPTYSIVRRWTLGER